VGVTMPSMYSSRGSVADSGALAERLGIELRAIPIAEIYKQYEQALAETFRGTTSGVAEENLQSRIRGNLLMALSNKFGWMVLTTGNKSEMSTGYATLYGDMCGGYAVLKDVPKTLVYRLARRRNDRAGREVIPRETLEKAPSAELRPDQKDVDSLPPYDVLDPILEAYVEHDRTRAEIARMGFDPETVDRVARLVDANEYKRRQSPPGVRISARAFGKDRRVPITSRFKA
ncbi:MAG: NAD(+) synthase, partial [Candidatus Methylomirabilis sp.]|nr:NAD(+) synthase [Deltaproteobacteria bacterium]